jgi:hypothetical protein
MAAATAGPAKPVGVYVTVAELRGEPEVPDAAPPADA